MKRRHESSTAFFVGGAILAGVFAFGQNASAVCALWGSDPSRAGSTVSATGGRSGCSGSVNWVTVYLRKQRTGLPDINIASNTADVPDPTNVTRTASTTHNDPLTARTRVQSSTGAMYETAWTSGL